MNIKEIENRLRAKASAQHKKNFSRFGINAISVIGVTSPDIKALAKEIGRNHELALSIWPSEVHEMKHLAIHLADHNKLTDHEMDTWVQGMYSWDLCDSSCMHLFRKSNMAYTKSAKWVKSDEEFIKRCGLVLMTTLALHDKKASNETIIEFVPYALDNLTDERNFVKKANSWLLRQIGKRNELLRKEILRICYLKKKESLHSKAANWVINDVKRELENEKIISRLNKKPA